LETHIFEVLTGYQRGRVAKSTLSKSLHRGCAYGNQVFLFKVAIENGTKGRYTRLSETALNLLILLDLWSCVPNPPLGSEPRKNEELEHAGIENAEHFFRAMRGVPVNPAQRILPSMPVSFPAGRVDRASAGLGIPFQCWLFGTSSSWRFGMT
jgi:hypothetical protein